VPGVRLRSHNPRYIGTGVSLIAAPAQLPQCMCPENANGAPRRSSGFLLRADTVRRDSGITESLQVEAIQVHDLVPGLNEVLDELGLGVIGGIHLGEGPQLRVVAKDEIHTGSGPLDCTG
jgi:hypothetical protein